MTPSKRPSWPWWKTASAGTGPETCTPSSDARSTAGRRISISSSPISPPSPACGFSAASATCGSPTPRGRRRAHVRLVDAEVAQQASDVHDRAVHAVLVERVDGVAQRQVAGQEEDPQLPDDEHRVDVVVVDAEAVGQQLGVARELEAAPLRRLLVDRAGDEALHGAVAGQRAGAVDPLQRRPAVL